MSKLSALLRPAAWRRIQPRLDPLAPVLRLEHTTDPGETKLRAGVGLAVLVSSAFSAYWGRDDWFLFLASCGFCLFGVLNLVMAVVGAGYRLEVVFKPDEVVYRSRWMGREMAWREPLSAYKGVLLREEQSRRGGVGNADTTRTLHFLELAHDDPAKTVPLYYQEGGTPPRELQYRFAKRFRLPVLAQDSGRDVALDALPPAVRDPGPPPSGVRIETRGDTTRVVIGRGRSEKRLTLVVWASFPLAIGAVAYQIEPMAGYLAGGMAALLELMILTVGRLFQGKEAVEEGAICLDGDRIWVERPGGPAADWIQTARTAFAGAFAPEARTESLPLDSMPRSAVEQIRVDTYASHDSDSSVPHARLLIEARAGRLEHVGTQFDRKKLEWARDYLRYRLSTD